VDYVAEIYRDAIDAHWDTNPYAITIEARTLNDESVLELPLAAGGGMAVRFRPIQEANEE
jgi:alpha-glucosidase